MDNSALLRGRRRIGQRRFENSIPVEPAVDALPATIFGLRVKKTPRDESIFLLVRVVALLVSIAGLTPTNVLSSFVDELQELGEGPVRELRCARKRKPWSDISSIPLEVLFCTDRRLKVGKRNALEKLKSATEQISSSALFLQVQSFS